MFSCEFCEIFKNTFFTEHLRWLLLMVKPLFRSHFGIRVTVFQLHCSLKMLNMHFIIFSSLSSHLNIGWLCFAETFTIMFWDFREHACMRSLLFSAWAGFFNRWRDCFQLVYMGWKFQLVFLKPSWNFSKGLRWWHFCI